MTSQSKADHKNDEIERLENSRQYLIVYLAGQTFGLPVLQVQDVLGSHKVTHIPLAPPQVEGSLNLRGRIVTAINVRRCLGLEENQKKEDCMSVVVEHRQELFSLVIDKVGDVLSLHDDEFEPTPPKLDKMWRDISTGIYRLDDSLLIILDVPKLLQTINTRKDAALA